MAYKEFSQYNSGVPNSMKLQTGSHTMYCTVYFCLSDSFPLHQTSNLVQLKKRLFSLAARGKRLRVRQKFEDDSNQIPAPLCFVPVIITDVFNSHVRKGTKLYIMRNAVLNRKKPSSPSPAVHQLTLLLLVATSATFLLHKLGNVFFFAIFHLGCI